MWFLKQTFILFVLILITHKSSSKAILQSSSKDKKSTSDDQHQIISSNLITINTKWMQNGITIAGGNQYGSELNQLYDPTGISIDDDEQSIYIADSGNDRIIKWKFGEKNGEIVAGGNGRGNELNQLDWPTDVILDKKTNSIIICDLKNRRVVRWSLLNKQYGQIIISDIDCGGLQMDNHGDIYVSDYINNEIRRWTIGETEGTLVAGGNGRGNQLNQLNYPIYFFLDKDYSIYISDHLNHRVMKWTKNAKEGIIVAGGQGRGNLLTQLKDSAGVTVDHLGNIYVVDSSNDRIMRWIKGSNKGNIIVGGNKKGEKSNQFDYPTTLSFDRQGNLYVADFRNHRIQKFIIDKN